MSGYVKILMSLHIDDDKLLEKYKIIWTKTEDLKKFELDAFPVYDDRYIKTRRTYGGKVCNNLSGSKCAKKWCRMSIFYSHLFLFFICL